MARAHTLATLLGYRTTTLLKQAITTNGEAPLGKRYVEDGIYELISWLTILDCNGDTYFCSRLSELAAIRTDLQESIAASTKSAQS